MRHFCWGGVLFGFSGCSTDSDNGSDDEKIPGVVEYSKVADVSAVGGNEMVKLNWTNPSASDFYGTEITFTPAVTGVNQPIIVTGVSSAESVHIVQGLANGTEYTFFLTALYKSSASTIKGTPNGDGFSKDDETVDVPGTPTISVDDTTPPAAVTGPSAESLSQAVRLAWTDPADTDLFGIEIAWKKTADAAAGRSIAPMSAGTVFVAPGTQRAQILELDGGTEYTFTVTAMDTSGNKSSGTEISATPEAFIDIDNAGNISLANVAAGIAVLVDIPEGYGVGRINIQRSKHGENIFYSIGNYRKNSGRLLSGVVSFTDYYVEKGVTYDYKVLYQTYQGTSLENVPNSETDSLTAKSGLGLLEYNGQLTLNFDANTFEFSYSGNDSFKNPHINSFTRKYADFSLGEENGSSTCSVNITTEYGKTERKYSSLSFSELKAFDAAFVPNSMAGCLELKDGDDYYQWKSVYVPFIGGTGFVSNTITFGSDLPFRIEDVSDGVKFRADLAKFKNKDIRRVDFESGSVNRSVVYFSDKDRKNRVPFNEIEYVNKYVERGKKCKFRIAIDEGAEIKTLLSISVQHTPANGSGEVSLVDDCKIEYNEETAGATLSVKKGSLLKNGSPITDIPKEFELSLDGTAQTFELFGSEEFQQGVVDSAYINDISIPFTPLGDGTYFANLLYRVANKGGISILGKALYPCRSRIYAKYYNNTGEDGVRYRIDSYIADSNRVGYVAGLPEPFVVNNNLSGKTFTVANPNGENVYGAEKVAFGSYTAGSNFIYATVEYKNGVKFNDATYRLYNKTFAINGITYDCDISGSTITLAYKEGTPRYPLSISISCADTIKVGEQIPLMVNTVPENVSNSSIDYSSSDSNVAYIWRDYDKNKNEEIYVLQGCSVGTVKITAHSYGGASATKRITVTPYEGVETITISEKYDSTDKLDKSTMSVGKSCLLYANVSPTNPNGTTDVTWASSNEKVATVSDWNDRCSVQALSEGEATITATADNGITDSVTITVTPYVMESISIDYASGMIVGDNTRLYASISPTNPNGNAAITWKSDNEAVVSISSYSDRYCNVQALSEGTATITATAANDMSASTTITVSQLKVESVSIISKSPTVKVGKECTLNVEISSNASKNTPVTWTSSDERIAKIWSNWNSSCSVGGISEGTVIITAEAGGKTDWVEITVMPYEVESLSIDTYSNVTVGGDYYLSAQVSPSNPSGNTDVTWTSNNESIATVSSEDGSSGCTLKAIAEGWVTITAEAGGKTASVTIKINGGTSSK